MIEHNTPISYAKYLAGYISDPSTVRARVADEYGRAPSVDLIRKFRREAVEAKRVDHIGIYRSKYSPGFKCGHPETEDNIVLSINGIDKCAICERIKAAEAKEKADRIAAQDRKQAALDRAIREAREAQESAKIAKALGIAPKATKPQRPRLGSDVIREVAKMFFITPEDITGTNRSQLYVEARCAVALILRDRGVSFPQIGRFMNRDHSTIINLFKNAEKRVHRNPLIVRALEELR